MRGRGIFKCVVDAVVRPRRLLAGYYGGNSRRSTAHARIELDQRRALSQIRGVGQPGRRDHEVGISEVAIAICIRESACLAEQVHAHERFRADGTQIEWLERAEDLKDGDPTGGWRWHSADAPRAIAPAYRLADLRLVARQVRFGHVARVGRS